MKKSVRYIFSQDTVMAEPSSAPQSTQSRKRDSPSGDGSPSQDREAQTEGSEQDGVGRRTRGHGNPQAAPDPV
jgi:hypothetical protein